MNLGSNVVHSSAALSLVLLGAVALSGCPGGECVRLVRCVQVCGGPVLGSGCGPCRAGTFDDFACRDGGTDAGPARDGGVTDVGPASDSGAADGGAPTACSVTSDCALRGHTCCGNCGSPALDDYVALHVDDVDGYGAAACAAEGFPPCALCDLPPDPYLAAVCTSGSCAGLDLRSEPLTECAAPSDCVLGPRTCCDCGVLGAPETVAYNPAAGSLNDYTCDEGAPACPPCVPSFDGLAPDCVAGRCVVAVTP